jgi:dihydroorotate dehydrogenase
MPDLSTVVNGLKLPNPFVIGSGPPGTNANVIGKAFDEGWGAVICKTISLEADKVVNVQPRYARLRSRESNEIIGWENIELISDREFSTWIDEFKQLKDKYPDRVLIASIMEEYRQEAWAEIIERCEQAGVDAFECNFSCPHGLPERKMGSAMGENSDILAEVCGWVMDAATVPVWAKMTPNVTHIEDPVTAALCVGCHGVSAINTIRSVIGKDQGIEHPQDLSGTKIGTQRGSATTGSRLSCCPRWPNASARGGVAGRGRGYRQTGRRGPAPGPAP